MSPGHQPLCRLDPYFHHSSSPLETLLPSQGQDIFNNIYNGNSL